MSTTSKIGGHAKTKLWVRMYRVGFGDCFLVAVPTKKGPRFILIDCGEHRSHVGSLPDVVADIAKVTGKHLSLIIATHRHADHIRGFYTCTESFQEFTVDKVWMSWWDHPTEAPALAFQDNLVAQAEAFEERVRALAADDAAAREALELIGLLTGLGFDEQPKVRSGSALVGNKAALAMLRGDPADPVYHFKNKPETTYYQKGSAPDLPAELKTAGLTAKILGPPGDPALLNDMEAEKQYLRLAAESARPAPLQPFAKSWRTDLRPVQALRPLTPRQLDDIIARMQPDELLAAAALAANTVNNQSLVVLFTFGSKTLLFTGDAQWGNWENFLYGQDANKAAAPALLSPSKKMLMKLNLYKVGHHGSTNATPIVAVAALRKGAVSLCSTQPDCFGHKENNSEVPRAPLLEALRAKGPVVYSDQVAAGTTPPTDGRPKKLPPHCSSPGSTLYIDYEF